MNERITMTESEFNELDSALRAYVEADAAEAKAKAAKDEARAKLQELGEGAMKQLDNSSTPFPGVSIAHTTKVKYDADKALNWALRPENKVTAAPLLSVRQVAVGYLLGMQTAIASIISRQPEFMKEYPELTSLLNLDGMFELNKTSYERAVREGTHAGAPHDMIESAFQCRITVKGVKTGQDLRKEFDVIADDEPLNDQPLVDQPKPKLYTSPYTGELLDEIPF